MGGKIPARLNILTLGVRDLPKVRSFYEALGWESRSEGDEFARFQIGGATLALFSLNLLRRPRRQRLGASLDAGRDLRRPGRANLALEDHRPPPTSENTSSRQLGE